MDSRSFWFGAALALALLLFLRERKSIENTLGLEEVRNNHGAGSGAGAGAAGGSCCEKCAGDTKILPVNIQAPLAPNYSAPAHFVAGSVQQPTRSYNNPLPSRFFNQQVSRFFN